MRIMLGSMGKDKTIAPPENVLKRAVTAFKQIKRAATERPCIRIMATPMQLAYVPATVNTRSFGGQSRSRQMLFTADDLDIDLQVRVEKDSATLMGQVLGGERQIPAFVHIHYPETGKYAGEVVDSAATDAFGQFSFRPLPSGVYDLIVELENKEIAIEGLHLGAAK